MSLGLNLGRYSVYAELASGGMATVYLGRMTGAAGFGRTVAIKRLHPHLAKEPEFFSMFVDEARLAARVQHPNVVPTLDVVTEGTELFIVMEYVRGESLGGLLRASRLADRTVPVPVAVAIAVGLLNGLHAAHEAKDERGEDLHIVHRDVSPQNVLVGSDGVARVLDFGVAKAKSRLQTTRDGQIKGKIAYMAPEQIGGEATRRSDIYAAGVVLWESLTCSRLFVGENDAQLLHAILSPRVEPPSALNDAVPPELDRIVLKAIATDGAGRYATARDMAEALDACLRPASANQVAEWMKGLAGSALEARSRLVAEVESHSGKTDRSEVRRLIELGPAALLLSDTGSGPPVQFVDVPGLTDNAPTVRELPGSGTGASLSVASSVKRSLPPPHKPTMIGRAVALAAAVLVGAGLVLLWGRGFGHRPAEIPQAASAPANTTPQEASAAAARTPTEPAAPAPASVDAGSAPAATAAGATSGDLPATKPTAHPQPAEGKKPVAPKAPPAPQPAPKPSSTTDLKSLLDTR